MPDIQSEKRSIALKARHLLATGWCKGELAVTVKDRPCQPTCSEADRYCILGALVKSAEVLNCSALALQEIYDEMRMNGAAAFNDRPETTLNEVLAYLQDYVNTKRNST